MPLGGASATLATASVVLGCGNRNDHRRARHRNAVVVVGGGCAETGRALARASSPVRRQRQAQ